MYKFPENMAIPVVKKSLCKRRVPREFGSHATISSTNAHYMYNNFIAENR